MISANKFENLKKIENGYLIETDGPFIKLIFLTEDIIRVRASFDKKFIEESYVLTLTAWKDRLDSFLGKDRKRITAFDAAYTEDRKKLVFKTSSVILEVHKEPFGFKLYDNNKNLLYSDLLGRSFVEDQLGRKYHYNAIDLEKDHFYGFGEKTGKLDKKGRRMVMSPKDAIGHDPENGDPLYKHIPFYIRINETNKKAAGLFYHNSYDSVFDMGCEISGYWPRYSYYMTDGGDIDLFLINGSNVKDIIARYTDLTGKQAFPPKQTLGYTASTMYYAELKKNCDQEIYHVIDKHIKEDIPIDNFWLASGYSTGEFDNLRYTFNWNTKKFPNPDEFFRVMNDKGINVIPNLKPGVLKNHPYAKYYEEHAAFIKDAKNQVDCIGNWWGGLGRFIDFTKPSGRNAWKKLLKENILQKGTYTVWNDNCEYDGITDKDAVCDFDGGSGTMAHLKILQSNLMAHVGREAIGEVYSEQRPYIISRAGFAGIQRYAQTWAGDNLTDWRTPKFNINTIMGMGLSGVANNGCDIGGFAGRAPEAELLLRWIQNGIFQPRFVMNSANNDNTVTEPWMYAENTDLVRAAYKLRYRLLPYMYSLMYEACGEGTPIIRPLFLEFPEDERCLTDENFTFMFGSSILVANVFDKGAVTRKLYLPTGSSWYYWETMEKFDGGQEIEIPVALASIPMFLRDTAIVPMTDDIFNITQDQVKNLELLVSSDKDGNFTLYEDDGKSNEYLNGVYLKTRIDVKNTAKSEITFTKEGSFVSSIENMFLKVINKQKGAYWVTVGGKQIKQYLHLDKLEEAEEGWYYNPSQSAVYAKYKNIPGNYTVVVSFEKFDLIGMEDE
ncbi:TIM-barrel domain-containing protein [Pelosinus fermentans]|uniref:Alpha-glucosidase n=1 Tax=Pelosinus fermentans JBW45 TaxID=1192197 RepID=I9NT72_9FIRM|nr:TIM-barrel domain-containing protein [Pelosinus fermentans]AJQ26356.1 Alpha-glucosidase [Pelosinus fermentans JBW45]